MRRLPMAVLEASALQSVRKLDVIRVQGAAMLVEGVHEDGIAPGALE